MFMKKLTAIIFAGALCIGFAVVPALADPSGQTMQNDNMSSSKMQGDKMAGDKMSHKMRKHRRHRRHRMHKKMANDKMQSKKM